MKVEYINPFIAAATNVIQTMASVEVKAGQPTLKKDNHSWGVLSGIIGLASDSLKGNMVLSFEKDCILHIMTNLLGEEFTQLNDEVSDAVGELTNMISGNAKKIFSEQGFIFDMAIPIVIIGQGVEISQITSGPSLVIPFETEKGGFVLEANLVEQRPS